MSGICGVVAFDGSEPVPAHIDAMTDRLLRRGPDGSNCWQQGAVGLGHALLATTPEALVEVLPLTDGESGCTITADARLDNRDALIADLNLSKTGQAVGDGELILRAYLRWGEDCPGKLLGDFAFVIWDPREEKLFCARDHMGMRQLLYHHRPGTRFVFATEAGAILAGAEVPAAINEGRIADFLDDLEGIDLTSTFFAEICRLPPAHCAIVTKQGLQLRRYWRLAPGKPLQLDNDEAYAAAFLEVFTESVGCRLRSPGPVGAMLSGGIDSGSVVAVAAQLLAADGRGPLHSLSAIGPDAAACIETRTIKSSAALPGLAAQFVNHADLGDLRAALTHLPDSGEPFDFHMTLIRAVYLAAHRQGIKVVLDGAGGDVALTAGNRVAWLLRRGRILDALREARGEGRFWGPRWPSWKTFVQAAWAAWVPSAIRNLRRRILTEVADRRAGRAGMVSASFAEKVDLAGRRSRYRSHTAPADASDMDRRVQSISHPHLVVARERYDRVASALAIEPRDPFMDIRLIEFCLSMPAEQLQAGGWPKLVLRRAMRGLLPEAVIWRRGKEHLGWAFTLALFDDWPGWPEQLESGKDWLARFVRPELLGLSNHPQGKALDIEQRFKLFFLLSWFRRHTCNPDAAPTSGNKHAKEDA